MADIDVTTSERADGYEFDVRVQEGTTETQHTVTLRQTDYDRLTGGRVSADRLVTESFRFLLEREPKESILRSFDLTVISRYFPEYEREIKRRL